MSKLAPMNRAGGVLCPIIVGRDDVLELVDERIRNTTHGRGSALFLAGQAGLGKTRLIRAAIRRAEAAGLRVDGGAIAPQDRQVPLASIREMALGMRGNEAFGSLSEDLLAIDGKQDGDALGRRRLIVRSTADRILEAIDRPTMLIFDDLHWADEISLEVIGELARHAAERPLFLLGGYRRDEFPADTIHREWRARLLSQRHAEEVRLRPLTLDETAIATTLILGRDLPAPRDVVEAVHDRTNGIPLHIEELLAALDDDARTDARRIRDAHVPDTIGDAVLARLARLSQDAQALARAGAVVGGSFKPDVMAGMLDRPLAELEATLDELVEAAILHPFQYIDHGYYDFRHQLLRDAIYSSVPPAQLRRFHAQAAEFVMNLQASSIVHASRHYEQAGLRDQAYRTALTAAQAASRISARQEAYELYRRAIDNMPADLPIAEQADLYGQFADAAGAIEMNEDCAAAGRRARELYLQAGRPLDAAGALLSMSVLPARNGSPNSEKQALTEQGLEEVSSLPATPDRELLRAIFLNVRAADRFFVSDLAGARADALAGRQLAQSLGNREEVLEADLLLARIDISEGRIESGFRDGLTAAREARDAGFESVGVTGYRNLAILAARVMDAPTADLAIAEGLQYADAIEQSHCRQMIASTRGLLDWAAGDWDAADERARHELVDRGCRRGVSGCLDVIGLVALGRGHPDEARRWLDDSLASGRRMGEVQFIIPPLWGLAEADLLTGDAATAIARSEEAWSLATSTEERALLIPFVVTGARSYLAARQPEGAERWVTKVGAFLGGWDSVAGPALNHAEGLLRLAAGSSTAARDALDRAIRGWEQRGRTWEAAWGRLDLARVLIRMNRYAEAATVLAAVRATAQRLGSEPLVARAEELLRVTRAHGDVEEPWRPLTAREHEVARLIADGLTNAEVADALSIAPKTASAHVEHILAKLGATRRAEIAAWVATIQQPAPVNGNAAHAVGAREEPAISLAR
jgi:DNA-binding CsgD family transcriptional regulator